MAISSPNNLNGKQPQNTNHSIGPLPSPSKLPNPSEIRLVGGRTYDSENGKTCHQCRQKTLNMVAACKNVRSKPCTIKFCKKCLWNRYGEKVEETAKLNDWRCPKCRGVCNCSRCMKRKGQQPTGILTHAAKATGFLSVMEMLQAKGQDALGVGKILKNPCSSPNEQTVPSKELGLKRKHGKENAPVTDSNSQYKHLTIGEDEKLNSNNGSKKLRFDNVNGYESEGSGNDRVKKKKLPVKVSKKANVTRKEIMGEQGLKLAIGAETKPQLKKEFHKIIRNVKTSCEDENADEKLPLGSELVNIAGIELPASDVGPALQFLEFCSAFQRLLDLKKGQAESVLRELTRGRVMRRGLYSSIVQFHIKLLSLIQKDLGEISSESYSSGTSSPWLQALGKCISESRFAPKELPLDSINRGTDGYDKLDSSQKLKVLNFLCDEMLGTEDVRNYIDEEQTKYVEKMKQSKEKILVAKEKDKCMKQKLKDKAAKVLLSSGNDAPLSIFTEKQRLDAVRTEPILLDGDGQVFWKLRGHSYGSHILLQDIGNWDSPSPTEKWIFYDDEQEKAVNKYICTKRMKCRPKVLTPLNKGMMRKRVMVPATCPQ